MDLPLVTLLLLAAVAHAGVLLVVWALLVRTLDVAPRRPNAVRRPRRRKLAARIGALVMLISVAEAGIVLFVDALSRGMSTELVGRDPFRAGIVFTATYATLVGWLALAGRARQPGGSVSMAVGTGMTISIVALTVSTLPWIDVEPSCRVGTFFFHESKPC